VKSKVSSYDFDDIESEFNKEVLSFVEELKSNQFCSSPAILNIEQRLKRGPAPNDTLSPLSPLDSKQNKIPVATPPIDAALMADEVELDIRNFDIQTIVDYITQVDFEYFKKIHPCEFLKQGWSSPNSEKLAPNLISFTGRFNDICNWVVYEILNGETPKDRVHLLVHFIQIAAGLRTINNFNGMCAVMSGINNASIIRLKRTWLRFAKKEKGAGLEEMTKLVQGDENFRKMRDLWTKVEPPAIPFLAITLKDLTFLEDGNPDHLEGGGINFYKWRKISEVIGEVLEYQHIVYPPVINQALQNHIQNRVEKAKQHGPKGLHKLSIKCE